jgi:hypothetical protein
MAFLDLAMVRLSFGNFALIIVDEIRRSFSKTQALPQKHE